MQEIESRISLKKYHEIQLNTIETEIKQLNKSIIEWNRRENEELEKCNIEKEIKLEKK